MANNLSDNSILDFKRSIAIVAAVMLLFAMLFSAAFIAHESVHDCTGENCPICQMIGQCENFVKRIAPVFICAVFSFLLAAQVFATETFDEENTFKPTLLSLKVRLNN